MSERDFISIDGADAFLSELMKGRGIPEILPATPLERANDLVYEAWEAPGGERVRLARAALAISPDCADAYVLLAEHAARSIDEALEFCFRAVAAGERALGPESFEQRVGLFWGFNETRPYMRARASLAGCLWEIGRREEAIEHYWELLRLNPSDNQGNRYALLDCLLQIGTAAEQVCRLLGLYPDDPTATWLYGRALFAFRTEGGKPSSGELLAEAKRANPYVPTYILGRKRMPRSLPDLIGIGDESEAVDCAAGQAEAWRGTPGALEWLDSAEGDRC